MTDIDESFLLEVGALWPERSPHRVALTQIEDALNVLTGLSKRTREVLALLPSSEELELAVAGRRGDADKVSTALFAYLWNRLLGRSLLKCEDATRLLIFSTNKRNIFCTVLAARTIIEHIALVTHLSGWSTNFIGKELSDAEFGKFMQEMNRLAMGSNVDWHALFSGATPLRTLVQQKAWKRPKDAQLPKLSVLVNALDGAMATQPSCEPGLILLLYGIFSDLLHPSWGGDFMYRHLLSPQYSKLVDSNDHFRRVLGVVLLPISGVLNHGIKVADSLVRLRPGWEHPG